MTQGSDYASMAADIVKTMLAQGHLKDPTQIPVLLTQIGQNLRALGSDQPAPAPAPAPAPVAAPAPAPATAVAKSTPAPESPRAAARAPRERKAAAPPASVAPARAAPAPSAVQAKAPADDSIVMEAPRAAAALAKDIRPVSETGQVPAVPIRSSVTPDWIICLEDGRKMKMLKRHLNSAYGMSPEEYRAKWELPANYPMVAPNYAKMKSKYARHVGLGTFRMREEVASKRELEEV